MNANSLWSPRMLAGAAIVGLVGAAGVYIYEQLYAEKRRAMLVSEVQRLDRQMSSMRLELETLRELQKETHLKRQKARRARRETQAQQRAGRGGGGGGGGVGAGAGGGDGDEPDAGPGAGANQAARPGGSRGPDGEELSYASDSEYFTDYQSVLGTDGELDSEEFYDVHTDEEDDTLREETNGHLAGAALDEDLPEKCAKTEKLSPRHET